MGFHTVVPVVDSVLKELSNDHLLVVMAMSLSMLTQLLLLLTGGMRKWHWLLRFTAWTAYNVADSVAILALGLLAKATQREPMYSLWAPMLLLHLGGPDNISAYAVADAELWLRHFLNMLVQTAIACVVVAWSVSGTTSYNIVCSALMIAGFLKYAERSLALRFATRKYMTSATECIQKYMSLGQHQGINGLDYVVEEGKSFNGYDSPGPKVTLAGLCGSELLREPNSKTKRHALDLCLAFALFKIYRRRLVKLYLNEGPCGKLMHLFLHMNQLVYRGMEQVEREKKILEVVGIELRFIFDSIYTKAAGTAFRRTGVVLRVLNVILLTTSGIYVFDFLDYGRSSSRVPGARALTMVLLGVGMSIEFYQIFRLLLSDWTQVWLTCTVAMQATANQKCSLLDQKCSLLWAWFLRLLWAYWPIWRSKYWTEACKQEAIEDAYAWNNRRPCHKFTVEVVEKVLSVRLHAQKSINGAEAEKMKNFVIRRVLERAELAAHDGNFHGANGRFPTNRNHGLQEELESFAGCDDLENFILTWHIATHICAVNNTMPAEAGPVNECISMSRYALYLLSSLPELLPLHPEVARKLYKSTVDKLGEDWEDLDKQRGMLNYTSHEPWRNGPTLARHLLSLEDNDRWKTIGDAWVNAFTQIAVEAKVDEHLAQLTRGGEFITVLWVMLGHMGIGKQV